MGRMARVLLVAGAVLVGTVAGSVAEAHPRRDPLPAVCGRDSEGNPQHCRCLPTGLPVDPAYWGAAGRQEAAWHARHPGRARPTSAG